MRRREARKAPDIDVLARCSLQLGLRAHPDVAKHAANAEIEDMPMLKLLKLAKNMGVEPNDVIEMTEREETERSQYSMRYPAFRGELGFDMTISFLGESFTRKAKMVYEHTPEWEYFDERKQAPYEGRNGTMYHLEIMAIPEEYDGDDQPVEGKPY